jgi:hypothetical protein
MREAGRPSLAHRWPSRRGRARAPCALPNGKRTNGGRAARTAALETPGPGAPRELQWTALGGGWARPCSSTIDTRRVRFPDGRAGGRAWPGRPAQARPGDGGGGGGGAAGTWAALRRLWPPLALALAVAVAVAVAPALALALAPALTHRLGLWHGSATRTACRPLAPPAPTPASANASAHAPPSRSRRVRPSWAPRGRPASPLPCR